VLAWPLMLAGCQNPYAAQLQQAQQDRLAALNQNRELQARLNELDAENQRINQVLAQSQRQGQLLLEQAEAIREQLRSANSQVARLKDQNDAQQRKVEALQASAQRQGGASISPNNSWLDRMPPLEIPGAQTRRDGDTLRIELPAASIFSPGDVQLTGEGARLLDSAASQLHLAFPNHRIAIEAHLDSDPASLGRWGSAHQLTAARALAVADRLARGGEMASEQFEIRGLGATRPLFSNATAAGRERNGRIEIVVFPETIERPRR
jgi:flagellar motor protein MotB